MEGFALHLQKTAVNQRGVQARMLGQKSKNWKVNREPAKCRFGTDLSKKLSNIALIYAWACEMQEVPTCGAGSTHVQ
ncbi:hypothetical protein HAX54_052769, partial [Datura stramonium]|nr:hypothetical protein [Datura stramonium]